MSQTGFLELVHEKLYWPSPDQILKPSGAGAKFYAELADKKIGHKLRRERPDASGVKVGILAANPQGNDTEAPIAIVCEFPKPVSADTIKETYRLAWSFSRARSLITIEPNLLRVWSCCEHPDDSKTSQPVITTESSLSEQAAKALQWVELVSGQFFQNNNDRFKKSGSADQMLLSNLKEVRRQLHDAGLQDYATIHDLLARIIFIQFLFQKRDSEGNPALNERILQNLYTENVLSKVYQELPELLESFDDTYRFFRWLNIKFNGDLFPGKGESQEEQEIEWQAEIDKIRTEDNRYLNILSRFVRGDLEMRSGQLSLWKYYSFDVIPLDFISSIYEEFVSKNPGKGVHYTPEHIVDFVLDGVLPWNGEQWDLKILDPCCGSGIFLVKAFQRLIYRWEKANHQKINTERLRFLLENNLFGIDVDEEAVRVASLSFYLTMLDSINPLDYWENAQFPMLRNRRLITADFFAEDIEGFRTELDARIYDLVIGNAPWGKNSIKSSQYASDWENRSENKEKWKAPYGNIGLLFLPKAAALTKLDGQVAMMQPAMPILFNHSKPAKEFRDRLFNEFKIEEVVNLSALRFGLFKDAISPTCIITFQISSPNGDPLIYICPKPLLSGEDDYRIVIEPHDVNSIYPDEARLAPYVWATLMWGGRRDLALMMKLAKQRSIDKLVDQKIATVRQGVCRGDKGKSQLEILNRPMIQLPQFPLHTFLFLDANELPINKDCKTHSKDSTDFSSFKTPQLIIKKSWQSLTERFQAVIVRQDNDIAQGVICSESYVNVHFTNESPSILGSACLTYNSKLAVYFLFLSNGSFASYIHKIELKDIIRVPIPEVKYDLLANVSSYDEIDESIRQAFSFKDSEWVLIEDIFKYTLPDFKGNASSPGKHQTQRQEELDLTDYCQYFLRVIKAGFGSDKLACATIFQEPESSQLPIRLIAIHLNYLSDKEIRIEQIDSLLLLERLEQLNTVFITQKDSDEGGIFYQRVARIYDSILIDGVKVPTVYLIKPDRVRYWTRSSALRDADETSADIMLGRIESTVNSETLV
jgi:type I restriction-modification system DNA methylase subunit